MVSLQRVRLVELQRKVAYGLGLTGHRPVRLLRAEEGEQLVPPPAHGTRRHHEHEHGMSGPVLNRRGHAVEDEVYPHLVQVNLPTGKGSANRLGELTFRRHLKRPGGQALSTR